MRFCISCHYILNFLSTKNKYFFFFGREFQPMMSTSNDSSFIIRPRHILNEILHILSLYAQFLSTKNRFFFFFFGESFNLWRLLLMIALLSSDQDTFWMRFCISYHYMLNFYQQKTSIFFFWREFQSIVLLSSEQDTYGRRLSLMWDWTNP